MKKQLIKNYEEFIEWNDYNRQYCYISYNSTEYRKACELDTEILSKHPMDGSPFPVLYNSQDYLNAHHFDYRGLIEKGLAIDTTNLNIY